MNTYQRFKYYSDALESKLNFNLMILVFDLVNALKPYKQSDTTFDVSKIKHLKNIIVNTIINPLCKDIKGNKSEYDKIIIPMYEHHQLLFDNTNFKNTLNDK